MEKRLRSSLQSSADEFLRSATKLNLKSSKPTLKSLIHSVPSSSPLSSSFPHSLHHSISTSIVSFRKLLNNLDPDSDDPKSPPTKCLRRSSRKLKPQTPVDPPCSEDRRKHILERIRLLAYIVRLCVSHPQTPFPYTDLLPSVQELHENLVLLDSDPVLSNEIASLCEEWWKEELPGRESLISQTLPFLLSKSLTSKKKVDIHRVYSLRNAFQLFEFEDDSIVDLKLLLVRCIIAPLYLKTEDGRRFAAFIFGLDLQLLKEVLAMIKSQIPLGRKSVLEAYGDILFRSWKGLEEDLKSELEGFLQVLVEGAIYASSSSFAASVRRLLGGFINQRTTDGVEKLLFRLVEPVIFRSLQVANSNVRQNALHLLLDMFPLEDPDATKEVKDMLLDKQFFLLERLLMDDCPDVRAVAVEGCCRILHLFWEVIPSPSITKIITRIFDDMSHDACNEVRLSTLNGIMYLLGNPQSHEVLKVLLPRLRHLMLDTAISIRVAIVDLLLLVRDVHTFQFNKVIALDVLLEALARDQSSVAERITRLLMPSYFPSRLTIEQACNRCVALMKRSPLACARFCEFALSEGASLEYLMELIKVFIGLVLSNDKLDAAQVEGLLVASAYLCSHLASEPSHQDALKELLSGERIKCLFAAASTECAQSSVINIAVSVSSENVTYLLEDCIGIVTDSSDLSENVEKQAKVRSAHKLLMSCDVFDDLFDALTNLLRKAAYRCHIKFDTELPKKIFSSAKRKNCNSSVKYSAKWKHMSGKKSSKIEDDYKVAVGISWQIKDLLASEDNRKAILSSQALELPFLALKVISEVSIVQCMRCEFMDPYPILAYTAIALHMAIESVSIRNSSNFGTKNSDQIGSSRSSSESILDQVMDHLLDCADKLFKADDFEKSANSPSNSKQGNSKSADRSRKKRREPQADASGSTCDTGDIKQKLTSKKFKIVIAVLKFTVDSIAMGFASKNYGRCLKFTSAYVQFIISALGKLFTNKSQLKEHSGDIGKCLKISFSYAGKLLNLILKASSEASPPPVEAFDLANDLLDIIPASELYLGSNYTASLVAATVAWLPDLILALGSTCLFKQTGVEMAYLTALDHIKLKFPSWPLILAKIELSEISEGGTEKENDRDSESEKFCEFIKVMKMIVSLLKANPKVLDAVGLIFLISSVAELELKDFGLVLGLVNFVCMKLIEQGDREWSGLDMMLVSLPEIYPRIEREIEELSDEDKISKLNSARALLEPVWMYHVYESERFSVMEED